MSFAELLAEIPALTRQQRQELSLRLIEMDTSVAELEDMAVCEQFANVEFALMDSLEAEQQRDDQSGIRDFLHDFRHMRARVS